MTVWTPVSLDEANEWLAARSLGRAVAISPVGEGVEDSVFRLDLADGSSVCLRIFERTEPEGPLSIAMCLANCGLPTCPPLEDGSGHVLMPLNGKQACLFPWIDGAWVPKPSQKQIEAIGLFMGHMAKVGLEKCKDWRRENPRGWKWFEDATAQLIKVLKDELRVELEDEMSAHRKFWQSGVGAEIPRGPVHADLFRNNVMFKPDGSLGAVIDWGFCASDVPLIYDLAIVANEWCLKEDGFDLDEKKLKTLLRARESVFPLSDAEKTAWPMALRLAALRFYLSRLYDYHFPRDPDGKALDPDYFRNILRMRQRMV
ncbi:MAG: homoserine kinase [Alphaproteobacteria bacterium]|nr:homoserine kinase [Alphaproteobacteria bacterium]